MGRRISEGWEAGEGSKGERFSRGPRSRAGVLVGGGNSTGLEVTWKHAVEECGSV